MGQVPFRGRLTPEPCPLWCNSVISQPTSSPTPRRLLIAASGTGGHVFPALAVAQQLSDFKIEWLGVPDRLETRLVGDRYPLHTITVAGLQQKLGLGTVKVLWRLLYSITQVRALLRKGQFDGVFTTGGYIAAPVVVAARLLGLPVMLHESNALPGKVTRLLGPWCTTVAIGFEAAARYLGRAQTLVTGTPVREQFLSPQPLDLPIPADALVIAVVGGSQGAVAVNQLVRQCAPGWLEAGAWIVHQTGESDPEADSFHHPHYIAVPFYDQMAGLLQRANLVVSRSGAGTLTELAMTRTPAILIPYPYAAEDHQMVNARVFEQAGAARVFRQADLSATALEQAVLELVRSPETLEAMADRAASLAVTDSATRLANLVRQQLNQP